MPASLGSAYWRLCLSGTAFELAVRVHYPLQQARGAECSFKMLTFLGAPGGSLAVIGGTGVFGLFLEIGYDSFHLSRAKNLRLPGGRPLFPKLEPEITPEEILATHGLKPGMEQVLDAIAGVTLVTWVR